VLSSEANQFTASQAFTRILCQPKVNTIFQKPATCHYTEHCCVTAVRTGGKFGLTMTRTKPDVIIHDMKSQAFINISGDRATAIYSVPEVQVFSKHLKQLTKEQYNTKTEIH
jgi:hypothetical protein